MIKHSLLLGILREKRYNILYFHFVEKQIMDINCVGNFLSIYMGRAKVGLQF